MRGAKRSIFGCGGFSRVLRAGGRHGEPGDGGGGASGAGGEPGGVGWADVLDVQLERCVGARVGPGLLLLGVAACCAGEWWCSISHGCCSVRGGASEERVRPGIGLVARLDATRCSGMVLSSGGRNLDVRFDFLHDCSGIENEAVEFFENGIAMCMCSRI